MQKLHECYGHIGQPFVRLAESSVELVHVGHPAVLVGKHADKERPLVVRIAAVDLVEAREYRVVRGGVGRHAPAQVGLDQVEVAACAPLAQLGKHFLDEELALVEEVGERRRDKDADAFDNASAHRIGGG